MRRFCANVVGRRRRTGGREGGACPWREGGGASNDRLRTGGRQGSSPEGRAPRSRHRTPQDPRSFRVGRGGEPKRQAHLPVRLRRAHPSPAPTPLAGHPQIPADAPPHDDDEGGRPDPEGGAAHGGRYRAGARDRRDHAPSARGQVVRARAKAGEALHAHLHAGRADPPHPAERDRPRS